MKRLLCLTVAGLDELHFDAVLHDAPGCTGCALCALRCPFDAIRMVRTTARRGGHGQDIEAKVD